MADDTTLRNIILTTNATVWPLVESWVRSLRADGLSPRTLENYASAVRSLTAWSESVGLPVDPLEQTTDHMRRYVAAQLDGDAARGSTVTRWRCLQQWFKWLVEEDELKVSPLAKLKSHRS